MDRHAASTQHEAALVEQGFHRGEILIHLGKFGEHRLTPLGFILFVLLAVGFLADRGHARRESFRSSERPSDRVRVHLQLVQAEADEPLYLVRLGQRGYDVQQIHAD